jgi:rhamnulokinase
MSKGVGAVAAVDLGASSGRVIVGRVGPDTLELTTVHRFPNEPVALVDGLHWNILELYRQVLHGLRLAVAAEPDLLGVAVDAWAVDYALLRDRALLGTPYHYRDDRTARGVEAVHGVLDHAGLFARNGLQLLPFNTVYQLMTEDERLSWADTVLLVPDLISFWLTGERLAELTNASTTGLVRAGDADWDRELIDLLWFPAECFPPLVPPGTTIGKLRPEVASAVGAARPLPVTTVGSHDTASAVVGVPMTGAPGTAAYISCGTWALVGLELDAPLLTEEARTSGFTNEAGVDGRTRSLHNVMGLWLLSESIRDWERQGLPVDLPTVLAEAAELTGPVAVFDTDDPRFLPPGAMAARIAEACAAAGGPVPGSPAETVRAIVESLAAAFDAAIERAAALTGAEVTVVHVVGGGAQNALLCRRTAARTGLPVLAGPVEATAIGNVLVQARQHGLVSGSLDDLRSLVARTHTPVRYSPTEGDLR